MAKDGDEETKARVTDVILRTAASGLDVFLNGPDAGTERKRTAFMLLVMPFGEIDKSKVNYVSNGVTRESAIAMMKEVVARFEGQANPGEGHG